MSQAARIVQYYGQSRMLTSSLNLPMPAIQCASYSFDLLSGSFSGPSWLAEPYVCSKIVGETEQIWPNLHERTGKQIYR